MRRILDLVATLIVMTTVWFGVPVLAQQQVPMPAGMFWLDRVAGAWKQVSATDPLPVTGSFSATLSGFTGNGSFASLTATASTSASTALPTGTVTRITNLGSGIVSCTQATGAATGVVNNIQVGPSSSVSRVNGTFDHIACIDQTGSTGSQLVILEGGSGLGNDTGGGGGGAGGSSAITTWGGATLGAATAWGVAPTGNVNGVNANVLASVLPTLAATSTKQSDGSQKTQVVDGSGNVQPSGDAVGRAIFEKITDGTNTAAVKAASTAAAAADPSVVTNESPNSQLSTANGTTADAPATVPTTTAAASQIALLKVIANLANSPTALTSQYPSGAVPITASATGTTAATTATLAASASIKTYICGFSIRANATAAATANSTVTGTITGTMNYTQWTAPLASGIGLTEQIFSPCIPSSAINTGVAVISAAPGSGGVVSVSAWGYQL